ncbi:putative lipase atg15 [Smittium mucronatum]|uniref:triacylglycerol lipase n=1 Tax=Smittium mucronatum TaxID=133383 RepID=A0A1R0H3P8_9FUNG|nr:putative lipase atg15 [Smittium mucronatum]
MKDSFENQQIAPEIEKGQSTKFNSSRSNSTTLFSPFILFVFVSITLVIFLLLTNYFPVYITTTSGFDILLSFFYKNFRNYHAPMNPLNQQSSAKLPQSLNKNSRNTLVLKHQYAQFRPNAEYLENFFSAENMNKASENPHSPNYSISQFLRIGKVDVNLDTFPDSKVSSRYSYSKNKARQYSLQLKKRTNLHYVGSNSQFTPRFNKLAALARTSLVNSTFAANPFNNDPMSMLNSYKTSNFLFDAQMKFLSKSGQNQSFWDSESIVSNAVKQPNFNSSSSIKNKILRISNEFGIKLDSPRIQSTYQDQSFTFGDTVNWKYNINDGLLIPDVSDKDTIVNLAYMASNAYKESGSIEWNPLGENWKNESSIGWDSDGLRGHVFGSEDNNIIVISLKGTSASLFLVGGGPTSVKDKLNDNRLFSCCCARVDYSWSTVCDCYMGGNKCNITCLQNSLDSEDLYFFAAAKIIEDVAERYPDSYIVLTGHSLGGSIAALMGLTFGLPVVAFEAPGDRLAAKRLHLPTPPAMDLFKLPIFHIGHNTDPIYTGSCTGGSSSCYYAGYAMESKCHIGNQCYFDTAKVLGWRPDIRHHRIDDVIKYVLEPWGTELENTTFPTCEPQIDCVECGLWEFADD